LAVRWITLKRQAARERGLCITCYTETPDAGRATCASCNAAAAARVRRGRERVRVAAANVRAAADLERAGDAARERHLHADAARYYADALDIPGQPLTDSVRVCEKLSSVLALGLSPTQASPVFDRLAEFYRDKPEAVAKSIDILLAQARLMLLESRVPDAKALVLQSVAMAEGSGDVRLRRRAYCAQASLALEEIDTTILAASVRSIESLGDDVDADPLARIALCRGRAELAKERGDAETAFEQCDLATESARHTEDPVRLVSSHAGYGLVALALGRMDVATSRLESSVLLTRKLHVDWFTPWLMMEYAYVLYLAGSYAQAYRYLLESLQYDGRTVVLDERLTSYGIPIALQARDAYALARCVRLETLDRVNGKDDPLTLATLSAAVAQWHAANDRAPDAERVLADAGRRIEEVRDIWGYPIAVARFGAAADFAVARRLIERRRDVPCREIGNGCLHLFDALVARRRGSRDESHAREAARLFEAIGWHAYADLARSVFGEPRDGRTGISLAELALSLTRREKQVAELLLRAMTNREIAAELSISENTVESHVTSILGRLGLRSRHELRIAER
jgi:DNA-binding CsgD family transcriptional regulator